MKIVFDSGFLAKLKKLNIRAKKAFKEKIVIFSLNSEDPQLDNHPLQREYSGYFSIDVTANYRAIYKKASIGGETVVYFVYIGTHDELYD